MSKWARQPIEEIIMGYAPFVQVSPTHFVEGEGVPYNCVSELPKVYILNGSAYDLVTGNGSTYYFIKVKQLVLPFLSDGSFKPSKPKTICKQCEAIIGESKCLKINVKPEPVTEVVKDPIYENKLVLWKRKFVGGNATKKK